MQLIAKVCLSIERFLITKFLIIQIDQLNSGDRANQHITFDRP